MATLFPFRALRYDPAQTNGPLSAVVAPPYDVIALEQQEALYRKSPHNVVRLILGRHYDGDSPTDNRYTRAARTLRDWLAEGVLREDGRPAFYIYEQRFEVAFGRPPRARSLVRRGVLGALKLEPFGEGCVYPHEETFSSHKADRLQLFRACRANFSPIFGLVPDEGDLAQLLEEGIRGREPEMEAREESGVLNRVWVAAQADFARRLTAALGPRAVFIADGHHRYETACNYRAERRAARRPSANSGPRRYDRVLMMCVPMSDPGLLILPTHRIVQAPEGFAPARLSARAERFFDVRLADDAALAALAEGREGPVQYGVVAAGAAKQLWTAKPAVAAAMRAAVPGKSDAWRGLDTAVLHQLVLKQLLGLGQAAASPHERVGYTKDVAEVLARTGAGRIGFVLRPSRMEQVQEVAQAGERMPQKSTYFSPKLLSGLVMRRL